MSVVEETPFPFANFDPGVRSTQESEADPGGQDGQIFGFEGFVIAPAFDTTIVVGTVEFAVTGNVATDGFDLELGLFDAPLDDVVDGFGNSVLPSTGTGTGTVNLIPQPGTASLLGLELGLLGPSASRRRQPRRGASITAPCRAAAGDPRRSA